MKLRTWPLAAAALAGLLLLVVVSVVTSSRRAQEIYAQIDDLNAHHRDVDAKLRRLRSDVHLSGIYVRDYLLDNARERAPEYRDRLTELRAQNLQTVQELRRSAGMLDTVRIEHLASSLDEYWQTFDPLFDWTLSEKILLSSRFLRREVLPRRDAVLTLAQEIEELNNGNLAAERAAVTKRQTALRVDLSRLLWWTVLLGALVTVTTLVQLRALERRSNEQRARVERAEVQMRHLSQQLVAAQEEERKHLSRELHDEVGQMLSALRMELGRLERVRSTGDSRFATAMAECKQLADTMLRTVRNLAQGLRPSMLDDLGLQPALEWHAREFRRRFGLKLNLRIHGDIDALPEQVRTCVYRIVQEALTNCARHANAGEVDVTVRREPGRIRVAIADDGVGFDVTTPGDGLGLVGMQERVRELGGLLTLQSDRGRGTRLSLSIPLVDAASETRDAARAAG
jgi:signal transduction histidine kinase